MIFKDKSNNIELLEHRIKELEAFNEAVNKRFEEQDKKYARKLVETIVFGAVGAILVGFITSVSGGGLMQLLGG